MFLPKKALLFNQLTIEKNNSNLGAKTHEIYHASYIDSTDRKVEGYLKMLDDNYPPLLAQIAVAYSISLRFAVERAAEDRLVLDEQGNILGTFSIALPRFKPMLCSGESIPSDLQEREEVTPSVQTLLKHNMAELLVALWRIKNDDSHPGNVSIYGLIDFDMAGYQKLTSIIKGSRFSTNICEGILIDEPITAMELKKTDISEFPILRKKYTHWPANNWPSNLNYGIPILGVAGKHYDSYRSFRELAKNPVLQTESGIVSFQDQMFTAMLKELLVFDPFMMRLRYHDYFGNLPLNYTGIDDKKRSKLAELNPALFNNGTDNLMFVEFCCEYFQQEYNELYRTVVYYPGCEANESGAPVISFQQFLCTRLSAYRQIKDWMIKQNEKMGAAWDEYQLENKDENNPRAQDKDCVSPAARYNLERVEQRYHQIWRDAHLGVLHRLLTSARQLSNSLYNELCMSPSRMSPVRPLKFDESCYTAAWQIIDGEYIDKPLPPGGHGDNKVRECLISLNLFIRTIQAEWKKYVQKPLDLLTIKLNLDFCTSINQAISDYKSSIFSNMDYQEWRADFLNIVKDLQQLSMDFDLQNHLMAGDIPIENNNNNNIIKQHSAPQILQYKHTDKEIVSLGLSIMFDWAKTVDKSILEGAIEEIIRDHYEQECYNKHRSAAIRSYLKKSMDSGDNKLAYILSSGGMKSNSLNSLLVKHLMKMILREPMAINHVNLLSITQAFEENKFEVQHYTREAQNFAKTDPRFTHSFSLRASERFNNAMYRWADLISVPEMHNLCKDVLKDYTPGYIGGMFSKKERDGDIKNYLKKRLRNSELLALIFGNGKYNDNSFNTLMFRKLTGIMQNFIKHNQQARRDGELAWVLEIDFSDPQQFGQFLGSLGRYAKNRLESKTAISNDSAFKNVFSS